MTTKSSADEPSHAGHRRRRAHARRRNAAYRACDGLTGLLLHFGIVFTPWAFGTGDQFEIAVMNAAGFTLGVLLLAKWGLRRLGGVRPSRWSRLVWAPAEGAARGAERRRFISNLVTGGMVFLTVLVLAYIAVSALNARATFDKAALSLVYHEFIPWLPHSYDRQATWLMFWQSLGLALSFWSARDWLDGVTLREEAELGEAARGAVGSVSGLSAALASPYYLPGRWRSLLLTVCLSGGLLAAEGMVQRASGTNALLWLEVPWFNPPPEAEFGPFVYHSHAAQYFNLLWPVCAGFAWVTARQAREAAKAGRRAGRSAGLWLGVSGVLMAAAPLATSSRGGTVIALAQVLPVVALLLLAARREAWRPRLGMLLAAWVVLQLGIGLGWDDLAKRFETVFSSRLGLRLEIQEIASPMAKEHPWLGAGPGSFEHLYAFYRPDADATGHIFAHDDWLELRITFGWVGFIPILLLLAATPMNWLWGNAPSRHWLLPGMMCVGMAGCLLHARMDLPFQLYSILYLFLLWCCLLSRLGAQPCGGTAAHAKPAR